MESTQTNGFIFKVSTCSQKEPTHSRGKRTEKLNSFNEADNERKSIARRRLLEGSLSPTLAPALYPLEDQMPLLGLCA